MHEGLPFGARTTTELPSYLAHPFDKSVDTLAATTKAERRISNQKKCEIERYPTLG